MNFSNTYRDKKVLITGHTGFKGSWLLTWLHLLGADILGYALAPVDSNGIYNLIEGDKLCESVIADIRNKETLKRTLLKFEPDFIFHLAAQPLVRLSYEIPSETFEVNVVGTANLLEYVALLEKKCTVVLVTTDKVYENQESGHRYKETDTLGGYDPYSASKACTEIVAESFKRSFFNIEKYKIHQKSISTARAGNVIGGGDRSKDRIIPDIINSLEKGQPVNVRNPASIRPWQHVLEPLSGYLLLGQLLNIDVNKFSSAFNFGPYPQDHLTVKELVVGAIEQWGSGTWNSPIDNTGQPHEANLLHLDLKKVIDLLGWKPKLNSAEAIMWTINWYKNSPLKSLEYTIDQIKAYSEK